MSNGDGRPGRRRRVLWMCLLVAPLAVATVVALLAWMARDHLPEILRWAAQEWGGGLRVEVGDARVESLRRVFARDVAFTLPGAEAPFFAADRIEIDVDWRELLAERIAAVRLERPRLRWDEHTTGSEPVLPGMGSSSAATGWSIGRIRVTDGRVRISIPPDLPPASFATDLDLEDVGLGPTTAARKHTVAISDLCVGADEPPLLMAARVEATLSIADLENGRLGALRVVEPRIDLAAELPAGGGPSAEGGGLGIRVARLVVEHGRLRVPPAPGLPEVTAGFEAELRDFGNDVDRAHALEIEDVRALVEPGAPPMVAIPRARVEFSIADVLRRRRIGAVRVPEGEAYLGARARELLLSSANASDADSGHAPESPWRLGALDVGTLAVHVAELGPPVPNVTFDVHTTLVDVPLSAAAVAIADQTQRIELASLALYSPFDPFKKVVTAGSIFIEFSLGGLLRREVMRVDMIRPAIYLSEDLFWYMTSEREDAGGAEPSTWTIDRFQAELGSLVLEIGTVRRVELPITFHTEVDNVRLDNLADLKIAAELQVPEESYEFRDYDLAIDRVRGDLHFDYPPGRGSENFVSTLYAGSLTWHDVELVKGWLSLTFDSQGINGTFGGAGYSGYVNGGITVPYAWDRPWVGWASASRVDLGEMSDALADGVVEVTGPLEASVAVTIADRSLEHAAGNLSLPQPGHLQLSKLDDIAIPQDWPTWQRDLAKIAISALRDFDYDVGAGKLEFKDGVGRATLSLSGPNGDRNLEVRYHESAASPPTLDVRVASRKDAP